MLNFIKKMLSESGDVSSMRIMAIFSFLVAVGIAVHGINKGSNLVDLSILVGTFLGPAFGAKVIQKAIELRGDK